MLLAPRTLLWIGLITAGCGGPSREDRRTVDAWLNCDECIGGERDSVRALGDKAADMLESALEGPSPERKSIMAGKFERSYPSLPGPAGVTKSQYVSRLLENYVASYQRRAAVALADIGGNRGRSALDGALAAASTRGYRDDVIRTIRLARQTLGATPFAGTLSPIRALFGDTVTLTASPSQPFSGDELAGIDGAPFPAGEVFLSRDASQLRFLAVASAAGNHVVAVSNVGTTTDTQLGVMTIGSLLDANDRRMLSCQALTCEVAAAQPIPVASLTSPSFLTYTSFLSLWRVPPRMDTLDLFRIQPAETTSITANLDWSGSANLDLSWLRCATLGPAGNSNGATDSKPEETTVLVPAGDCWVLLVMMRPGAPDRAFAHLRVKSP